MPVLLSRCNGYWYISQRFDYCSTQCFFR